MQLILSSRHPRNSTYSTDSGQILYKVNKPWAKSGQGTATIRKAVPTIGGVQWNAHHPNPNRRAQGAMSLSPSENGQEEPLVDDVCRSVLSRDQNEGGAVPEFEGHFAFYAQVEFRRFESSRFRYDGLDMPVNKYFRKEGWSSYGRNRVFKASDGKEYRWEPRAGHLEMTTNDEKRKKVVRFREWRPRLGPLMKGRPATLEVHPSCEPILDEIMMTFVYCHKLRKDRKD